MPKHQIYLMTDQPPTCPECGRRVDWLGATPTGSLMRCYPCDFTYELQDDDGDTYD